MRRKKTRRKADKKMKENLLYVINDYEVALMLLRSKLSRYVHKIKINKKKFTIAYGLIFMNLPTINKASTTTSLAIVARSV